LGAAPARTERSECVAFKRVFCAPDGFAEGAGFSVPREMAGTAADVISLKRFALVDHASSNTACATVKESSVQWTRHSGIVSGGRGSLAGT
jgi:hypothetical protein